MHFLIPVDGLPHTKWSLDLATKVFALKGSEVTLLHVVEEPDPSALLADTSGKLESSHEEAEVTESQALLEQIAAPLAAAGAKVHQVVEQGFAAANIRAYAEAHNVQITIIATGQHEPAQRMLRQSVTIDLLRFPFTGSLVRAREIKESISGLTIIYLVERSADTYTIELTAPFIQPHIRLLAVTCNMIIEPADEMLDQAKLPKAEPIDQIHAAVDQAGKTTGREIEKLELKTPLKSWLLSFMNANEVALVVVPRERDYQIKRTAFGSRFEDVFLKAPCPTMLCRENPAG